MPLLPAEYINSICEVKTMSNDLFATGVISEITAEYIAIEDKSGSMTAARYGTELKVNVYNSRMGFRVLVGKVFISNDQFIRLVEVISLLDYERRHFFRVETNIRAHIRPYTGRPDLKGNDGGERMKVMVKNLSLGGALILSDVELREGSKLVLELNLTRRSCAFSGIVRRTVENDSGIFLYGCEFFDTSDLNTNALCAYVFQRQREQIHKKEAPLT